LKATQTPCVFDADGSSAAARAGRSRASFSTLGSKGRRKALWISKSDKLIEDAQRDLSALGKSGGFSSSR
jgi:hypothetical protein